MGNRIKFVPNLLKLPSDVPYARHYKPRFVYYLPYFSLLFIIKSACTAPVSQLINLLISFCRRVSESDIVMPEEARSVARELNIPYYETSVLTYFGIDEVFENAIRAALCSRRQQRYHSYATEEHF